MAEDDVRTFSMVAIGGSAGSLEVILKIVAALPQRTDTAFIIIIHRKNSNDSILTGLLATKTSLMVKEVEDKEPVLPGTVYIAPTDYHLLLESGGTFSLDVSERIHHSRPSIDVAFESAAVIYRASLLGILLSGANADGAAGLKAIAENGGYTIIQRPASAEVGFMPQQAMNIMQPDQVLDGDDIGLFLLNLLK
jgi:two-component system chemotaxis response regulator CheB